MNDSLSSMQLGMIPNEDIDTYHSSKAISNTKLKFFKDNFPLKYYQKYIAKVLTPEPRKAHFDFGHALEARVYGERAFEALVSISPYNDYKKDAAKHWRNEQWAAGKIVLSPDEDLLCSRCYDAVMGNPDARAIVEASHPQVTFRAKLSTVAVQCRSDLWCPAGVTLPSDGFETGPFDCDIKTTESISPGAFMGFDKQACELGYHHAAVFYRYVIRLALAGQYAVEETEIPFVRRLFIVVDKQEWPSCTVYSLPDELLELAEKELIGTEYEPGILPRLVSCYRENSWPGAPVRKAIEPSGWIKRKLKPAPQEFYAWA